MNLKNEFRKKNNKFYLNKQKIIQKTNKLITPIIVGEKII